MFAVLLISQNPSTNCTMCSNNQFIPNAYKSMKKIFYYILAAFFVISCNRKETIVHVVTDFNGRISDSILPQKNKSYTTKYIKIKGTCDDSVRISFGNNYFFYFKGKDTEKFINADFYGEGTAHFIFDPYKAKSGNLKIEFAIL